MGWGALGTGFQGPQKGLGLEEDLVDLTHVRKPIRRSEPTNTPLLPRGKTRELKLNGSRRRRGETVEALSVYQSVTCDIWGSERGCGTLQGSGETSGCVGGLLPGPALTARWDDLKEGVMGCEK